jgi:hypothetical protein
MGGTGTKEFGEKAEVKAKAPTVLHLREGGVYRGDVKRGLPNGFGKRTWPEGHVYEGLPT